MRQYILGLGLAISLAGCGDPLRDIARLNDVAVADGAANVAETPAATRNTGGGLFSRLLNRQPDDPTNAAVSAALADAEVTAESEAVVTNASVAAVAPERERRGLFGLFRNSNRAERPRTGPDATDTVPGAVMPFGEIARVCNLRSNQLGTQIESDSGYNLYDTIPTSTAPRPFYLTGFDDDCARTFTGAVVVTGDVETHEFVRYRPSNESIAYTSTDNAYEALKANICRVGRGQPCGERTEQLDQNTQFITVYNFFGGTFSAVPTEWAQILVHNGEVVAMSIKDGE